MCITARHIEYRDTIDPSILIDTHILYKIRHTYEICNGLGLERPEDRKGLCGRLCSEAFVEDKETRATRAERLKRLASGLTDVSGVMWDVVGIAR